MPSQSSWFRKAFLLPPSPPYLGCHVICVIQTHQNLEHRPSVTSKYQRTVKFSPWPPSLLRWHASPGLSWEFTSPRSMSSMVSPHSPQSPLHQLQSDHQGSSHGLSQSIHSRSHHQG